MKKALQTANGTLSRCLLMLFLALVSLSASATDFTDYTLGEKTTITDDCYFKFTAPSDGIITFVGSSVGSINLYEDEAMTTQVAGKFSYGSKTYNGESYNQYKEFSVNNGQTYYFSVLNVWLMSSPKFVLGYLEAAVSSLTLTSSNYTEGESFDITDTRYGQLSLTFNLAATSDSATISVPSKGLSAKIDPRTGNGSAVIYQLKDTLSSWLNAGSIEGGEDLVFEAPNVHARADENIKYGTDGTFKMTFKCPKKPHQLVTKTLPSPFLSYWKEGDTKGIMVLEFDYNVAPIGEQTAVAFIRVGDANAGDVYTEQFESEEGDAISVDGKKLLIDFTGVRRTYADMGLGTKWGSITIGVQNVKMADGSNAYSGGNGTSGSYTFTTSFEEVNSNLSFEWTPANGGTLTSNSVELYLSDSSLTFDAVKFNYQDVNTDQKYQEVVKNFTSEADGAAITYTIPVSDAVKNGKNVRVTLSGVSAADGYAHEDITAKFNPGPELVDDFDPTAVSPKDGSTLTTLSTITLTFDEDVVLNAPSGVEQLIITDATTGKNVEGTIDVSKTNSKQVIITPSEELKNTHKYTFAVGHAVLSNKQYQETNGKYGRFMKELDLTYTIYTASRSYDFDMDPLEGSTLNEISSIKITTKAGRNANSYGITATGNPEKSVWIENEAGTKVATAKLVDIVSESEDEPSGFYITFSPAITEAGKYNVVIGDSVYYVGEGNNAEPNKNEVKLAYTVVAAPAQTLVPAEVTPASESTVESLDIVTLTFTDYIYGVDTPVTALNQTTRQSVTGKLYFPGTEGSTTCYVDLDETITTDGNWTITIPAGVIGDQAWWNSDLLSGNVNDLIQLYYTVGNGGGETANVTADPADKSTVTSIKTITLTFNDAESAGNGFTEELATVTKNGESTAIQTFNCNEPEYGTDWNQMVVKLTDEITANGTYTISFPEGFFTLNDTQNSPAFTLTYYIGDPTAINGISANGEAAKSIFTISGVKVSKAAQKGIYIINGKKTVVK